MHLFSGNAAPDNLSEPETSDDTGVPSHESAERIRSLEEEIGQLRRELETLREQFAAFQKQFQ